ncbi:AAA family ATPase [Ruegeria hyattellae]|uniref:AAA family ATPase n=1 Tax=Ruegeria hyattellae TaxID=3233337 RepID=UPI00355B36E9
MAKRNIIILLVGPKGAGKTYLASRMEDEIGISFLRVEPIWLELMKEMRPGSSDFDIEGLSRVIEGVRERLSARSSVVLESTGTAPWFSEMHNALDAMGELILIKVSAPNEMCLDRIRQRDASQHIPVSDDRIEQINMLAERVQLPWSVEIQNTSETEVVEFLEFIRARVSKCASDQF